MLGRIAAQIFNLAKKHPPFELALGLLRYLDQVERVWTPVGLNYTLLGLHGVLILIDITSFHCYLVRSGEQSPNSAYKLSRFGGELSVQKNFLLQVLKY